MEKFRPAAAGGFFERGDNLLEAVGIHRGGIEDERGQFAQYVAGTFAREHGLIFRAGEKLRGIVGKYVPEQTLEGRFVCRANAQKRRRLGDPGSEARFCRGSFLAWLRGGNFGRRRGQPTTTLQNGLYVGCGEGIPRRAVVLLLCLGSRLHGGESGFQSGDGVCGNSFTAAHGVHTLVGFGFQADAVRGHAQ